MSDDTIEPLTATDEQVTLSVSDYETLKTHYSGGDTRHTVSESADKIVLKTEVKCGEGTRDQDKVNVKVKGNEPAPTADKLAQVLDSLEELEVSNRLRETQPSENDE